MSFVFVLCVCVCVPCHASISSGMSNTLIRLICCGEMGNGEGGGGAFRGRKIGIYFIKIFRLKNMRQQQGQ